jgi:hypothetical protein
MNDSFILLIFINDNYDQKFNHIQDQQLSV